MDKVQVARHPVAYSVEKLAASFRHQTGVLSRVADGPTAPLVLNRIGPADLRAALAAGFEDFKAFRTDVIFVVILYPLIGLVLGKFLLGGGLFYLAFPLVAGFALLGPVFGSGLYEMSRQRELGRPVNWASAFDAFRSPAIWSIVVLGIGLALLFVLWMATAHLIYSLTLGPLFPAEGGASLAAFNDALLATARGRAMVIAGVGAGFVFAAMALSVSLVSFPLLLDRNVTVTAAVRTSLRAARENRDTVALWGFMIASLLALGSLPFLIGLSIVLPVLGHATWHLYRRIVPR
jgi:uncharacterized membrane protein